MINFASLFGSFNRGGNSAINELLQKRGTTLDQLLDVDTFPNEYKSGNTKILEYMNYSKYEELINYVTVQGPADNQKKGYKFPMVAADVLSAENSSAIDLFLPEGEIQVEVEYKDTEEFEVEVDDDDQQYLKQQPTTQAESVAQNLSQKEIETKEEVSETPQFTDAENQLVETKQEEVQVLKEKKKKIVKEQRVVTKTRKQNRQPLIAHLLSYYEGPINYTLAGYNCKVLSMLFTKKPTKFLQFLFKSQKNYVELICNHIESKSVGDLITKILIWQNVEFVEQRKGLYNHLIHLMSQIKQSHIISNLAYTISEIIQKTSAYIKSKTNILNNQEIIQAFLSILYRTSEVHKVINNTIDEDENKSGYNCIVLHAYLHHTAIQTVSSFKIEEVLETFITKAAAKLRNIPNRRTLGMGRVKLVEIFSFLIRKQAKVLDDESKQNEMSSQLLQELYIHTIVAQITDFFSILLKLVQSFENNNILHNQVFRIIESILREPLQNRSALQQLLLNDENVLLKFILNEAEKDKLLKTTEKHTKRKGYIGHVINICKVIDQINNNQLLDQKIKKNLGFQEVMNRMVAADIVETNKSLAGYQVKKNPTHEVMFQKEDILSAYADFLTQCPKAQYQSEEPESSEQQAQQPISLESQTSQKAQESIAEKQLEEQQRDEEKYNEVVALSQQVDESNPKYWITHMNYDVDQLMEDVL